MHRKTGVVSLGIMVLLSVALSMMGQSAKTIQEKKISGRTVYEYFVDEGRDEPVIESIEKYDEQGRLLELKEFNRKSEVKRWEKYAYDADGRVKEEVYLNAKGRVERTEKSIYSEGLRIEKQFYDKRGRLYKRKVYEYEYRN
jgi:hypothetical protein